jgi:hypothetical protein
VTEPCRACRHTFEAHEHYRPGNECTARLIPTGACDCPAYRAPRRSLVPAWLDRGWFVLGVLLRWWRSPSRRP